MWNEMNREPAPPFSRLPSLFETLGQSVADFLEAKLALFRKELWEEGESLLKRTGGIVVAGLVGWAGFLAVTAGLVLTVDHWLANRALSALIVGAIYIAASIAIVKIQLKKLHHPLPKTRIELEKDEEWIRANT